ncbi:MAG: 2,3,4,5-tetrahydropyridine-2,6-dicarboxylate N-succinyltransferase, partial [Streptosporangiaceae bacterium]
MIAENLNPPVSAAGVGLATIAADGSVLDTWYPHPRLTGSPGAAGTTRLPWAEVSGEIDAEAAAAVGRDEFRGVEVVAVRTQIPDLSAPPTDAHDVWLRLHLLSHRLIRPHGANLDGIFGLLTNVAWTTLGPVAPENIASVRSRVRASRIPFEVTGVDKFPRMTDYVTPAGVRIADAARVRLGAHLAAGTTVMHE